MISLILAVTACGDGTSGEGSGQATDPASSTTTLGPETPSTSVATTTTSLAEAQSSTSTAPESQPIGDLMVFGDWGSGNLPQGAVAGAMQIYAEANTVAGILTTGDNLYSDDADFLMQPYGWAEQADLPWWIAWGNHDVESESRIQVESDVFGVQPRWALHRWGAFDVIILDSNQTGSGAQAEFLTAAMAGASRPTIVVMHHPPYSCSRHGSTPGVLDRMVSLFDDDVTLVLSGHDHNYQRFVADDVTYVVTGGGGGPIYPLRDCPTESPDRLAGAELHHFVALQQTSDQLVVRAIDVNGMAFDETTIQLGS